MDAQVLFELLFIGRGITRPRLFAIPITRARARAKESAREVQRPTTAKKIVRLRARARTDTRLSPGRNSFTYGGFYDIHDARRWARARREAKRELFPSRSSFNDFQGKRGARRRAGGRGEPRPFVDVRSRFSISRSLSTTGL